jgi:pyruvate formate lyase activating enzyme
MNIAGLQKFTMVDFPGLIAATVFTRGCTFACPFCHNPELVVPGKFIPLMNNNEVMTFFEKRKKQLKGVCITGGEPTLQKDLPEFIQKLKDMGYKIKLDTNGSNPEMLERLMKSRNVDYIAMDIKSQLSKYEKATNTKVSSLNIKKSIDLIINSDIDYEFRTTVCYPIHAVKDFEEIGKLIKGAKRYYIQNFVQSKHIDEHQKFKPFSDQELTTAKKTMKKYVKEVEIR